MNQICGIVGVIILLQIQMVSVNKSDSLTAFGFGYNLLCVCDNLLRSGS